MFYLVLVVLSISVGLISSFDKDLSSVYYLSDSTTDGNLKEDTQFFKRSFRRSKFVDVYSNYPDKQEVEKKIHKNYNLRHNNHKINKNDGPIDRRDTLSFQNLDDVLSSQNTNYLESEHGHIESDRVFHSGSHFGNDDLEYFEDKIYDSDDRNNYHYPPNSPFITKNSISQTNRNKKKNKLPHDGVKKDFVFLQSQMAVPDAENYGSFHASPGYNPEPEKTGPSFSTKKHNFSGGLQNLQDFVDYKHNITRWHSHVQKIPLLKERSTTISPETSDSHTNRYEEIELSQSDSKDKKLEIPNTRERIGELLKKYVSQIFIKNYTNKKVDQDKSILENNIGVGMGNEGQYPGAQNTSAHPKNPKNDQETKFFTTDTLWDLKNKTLTKIKNLFSIFTVIKFDNVECNATNWAGTWQGMCYTSIECDMMNGTALGNCANGYGVCCVFRGTCDDTSSGNCSYFKSPNYPDYYPSDGDVIIPPTTTRAPGASTSYPTPDPRLHWYYYNHGNGDEELDNLMRGKQASETLSCVFSVEKSDEEVNQMRIDFIDLDLTGPTNGTCLDERLIITGQNSNDQIPVICGYNTGQHVYVDVSDLTDPLQLMVLSSTGARKRFKIRICQYTDSCSTSQSNCLQYYTGVRGIIQSFNYDQPAMFNRSRPGYFNNLNYAICIRREAGYCSITYSNVRNGQTNPFQLVNRMPNGQLTVPVGQAGVDILNCPDDYVIIDGTRLCGDRFNDGSTVRNFSLNSPVTDSSAGPIVLNVRTNNNVTGLGFKLYYTQNPCPDTE